jgi:hypothetical protein
VCSYSTFRPVEADKIGLGLTPQPFTSEGARLAGGR